MAYNSNLEVEFIGAISGVPTFTQLEYHRETTVPIHSAETPATFVKNEWWNNIKTLLSDRFLCTEIRVRIKQNPESLTIPEYVLGVNETGSVASDSLPPYATVVMVKVPDNTTIQPVGATPFKNGRTSWSGIPEGQQDNGLLNSAAIGSWNTVFELLESITYDIGGTSYTWTLGLERGEVSPPKVLIAETYCRQKLGTQNTRKR